MRLLTVTLAWTVLLAAPAWAQIGNPAGVEPGTPESAPGTPAPHQANTQDRLFARLTAAGGMAEVALGQLADQKANHRSVKEFGRRMVQDHQKAGDQLKSLAKQANIPLPADLDADHQPTRAELERLSGAAFDSAYMQAQIVDHQKTVALLLYEISLGQDAPLQQFAAATLPTVLAHLQMARSVMAELTAQGAPATAVSADTPRPPTNGGAGEPKGGPRRDAR
jgi:putative membrane protein